MSEEYTILYARIKALAAQHKISLAKLQKAIGVRDGTISTWRLQERSPQVKNVKLVADFFDVSVDYLLGATNELRRKTEVDLSSDDDGKNIYTYHGQEISPDDLAIVRSVLKLHYPNVEDN